MSRIARRVALSIGVVSVLFTTLLSAQAPASPGQQAALAQMAQPLGPAHAMQPAGPRNGAPPVVREDFSFAVESLGGKSMKVRVLRPAAPPNDTRRFPTLYLLHGYSGDFADWESRSRLADYLAGWGLVIVMPDGENSWYTNSASDPALKFEDYIVKDLVKAVEERFPVIRARYGRAIAGLSMGGYGAIKIGTKFPQTFAVAAGLSGAYWKDIDTWNTNKALYESLLKVYGPKGSPTRAQNDVFALIAAAKPEAMPYFYLDCGTEDGLIDNAREVTAALRQKKIAYEYHEGAGAHTWQYWDENIRRVLDVVRRKLEVRRLQ